MGLDVADVQEQLRADGLDGWLLYDFHGSNPIAADLVGLTPGAHMTTRRWYYLIPDSGEPTALVHAIERDSLESLPGNRLIYSTHVSLASGLDQLLAGRRRLAMEYSPDCAIPYLSRVDGGTLDLVRRRDVEVVSSGDLVQRFAAGWSEAMLASHDEAARRLYDIKDRAFADIRQRLRRGEPTTEYDIQQVMVAWFERAELESDSAPVVAAGENGGSPHYLPRADRTRAIGRNDVIVLDLWGKLRGADAVYADITWVAFTGGVVPSAAAEAFTAVAAARDTAISLLQEAARTGADLRGWQVDRAARSVLEARGFGDRVMHRTGHSLGRLVHGNGVHLDDYETHDTRRLLPGTCVTVEPGLYFETFGVRTEVNVFFGARAAHVTGPIQESIVTLATD